MWYFITQIRINLLNKIINYKLIRLCYTKTVSYLQQGCVLDICREYRASRKFKSAKLLEYLDQLAKKTFWYILDPSLYRKSIFDYVYQIKEENG